MRKILLTFALIGFSIPSINAQDKTVREVTKDDYERATKYLGASVRDLVIHGSVNPNWLKNGNFWYNVNMADGKQFVFVNANNGKKSSYNSVESLLKAQYIFLPSHLHNFYYRDFQILKSPLYKIQDI